MKFEQLIKIAVISLLMLVVLLLTSCAKQEPQSLNPAQPQGSLTPHTFTTETPENVGPPTVVPSNMKPEEWVKEYYEAYKKGDFEKAYGYLPAVNKARETTENFKSSRSTMPITGYTIKAGEETQEGTATLYKIPVEINSNGMVFVTTWVFEKQKDGTYIVKQTVTAMGN